MKARSQGRKKNKNAYGYRFVRKHPTAGIDYVEIDPEAAGILREIAERILSDECYQITPATEAVRLNRAGVLSPDDHRAVMYGREPKGTRWTANGIKGMLISDAALGYLIHEGRAVIGKDGHPLQLAEPLWDRATQAALIAKTAPRSTFANAKAPKGKKLLSGRVKCGICGSVAYLTGQPLQWRCTARTRGIATSQHCKPAPGMVVTKLDEAVEAYFLKQFGPIPLMKQVFDPGSGTGPRIAKLEADRARLRDDRAAGLYDSPDDAEWFRDVYQRMGDEIAELAVVPAREAMLRWVKTGETAANEWHRATDIERREMLAAYGIKAVIYPQSHSPRLWIHCLNENTEASALDQIREAEQREQDADYEYQAWQHARRESKLAFASIVLDQDVLNHAETLGRPTDPKRLAYIDKQLRELGTDPDTDHLQ